MIGGTILSLKYFLYFVLYWIAFYLFGGYIIFTVFVELSMNFMRKEMDPLQSTYDYIVVGCGSAGSVIAQRLAEDKHTTVLVLEAGPYGGKFFDIPAFGPMLQLSSVDWQYRTVPQKSASKGLTEQISRWPMGRIVGGTGRLNNMVYMRGHSSDFNEWYEGVKDYSYERDILTYFKKSENHKGSYKNDTKFHSRSGPLIVEDLSFETPLASAFLEAVKLLNYPVNNLNQKCNTGFMKTQVNTNLGKRWTPAHNLFNHDKQNLLIRTNMYVQKVLFKSNYEAYGVEYSYFGEKLTVHARKGVILSAGVIGTPKILMLSGIGPREHLTKVKIKTKINLPVGNNLQDHITTGTDLVLLNTSLGANMESLLSPMSGFNYLFNSSGPWTITGAEVIGMVNFKSTCLDLHNSKHVSASKVTEPEIATISTAQRYKVSKIETKKFNTTNQIHSFDKSPYLDVEFISAPMGVSGNDNELVGNAVFEIPKAVTEGKNDTYNIYCSDKNQPDLGFMVIPAGFSTDHGGHTKRASGLSDKTWNDYFVPLINKNPITILPIVLHPKSKGTVRLLNKDPNSYPLIDPNYLSESDDVKILLKGIDIIKKIIATEPMQRLGAKLNPRKFPGCKSFEFDTELYWECYVRHLTLTSYHPVGTCKIGSSEDMETVVGYDFRVHGTNNLYVADASVMPSLTSANPNAAVVMIGEKAADEIKYHNYLNLKKSARKDIFVPRVVCRL